MPGMWQIVQRANGIKEGGDHPLIYGVDGTGKWEVDAAQKQSKHAGGHDGKCGQHSEEITEQSDGGEHVKKVSGERERGQPSGGRDRGVPAKPDGSAANGSGFVLGEVGQPFVGLEPAGKPFGDDGDKQDHAGDNNEREQEARVLELLGID